MSVEQISGLLQVLWLVDLWKRKVLPAGSSRNVVFGWAFPFWRKPGGLQPFPLRGRTSVPSGFPPRMAIVTSFGQFLVEQA